MEIHEIINGLKRIEGETGSLMCLGCEHKRNCSVHGCAIMVAARKTIEQLTIERGDILSTFAHGVSDEFCKVCAFRRDPDNCPDDVGDCDDYAIGCPLVRLRRQQQLQVGARC